MCAHSWLREYFFIILFFFKDIPDHWIFKGETFIFEIKERLHSLHYLMKTNQSETLHCMLWRNSGPVLRHSFIKGGKHIHHLHPGQPHISQVNSRREALAPSGPNVGPTSHGLLQSYSTAHTSQQPHDHKAPLKLCRWDTNAIRDVCPSHS